MEMLTPTKEVGEKIREMRGSRNLTQEELGNALGCTKMAISTYESGKRMPNDNMKIKIANYFGVSISSIFYKRV